MIIKLKSLFLLALFVVMPVHADGPALWSIEDEDTTIYLFGTVHVLKADTVWKTELLMEKLASAGKLVTELAPEQVDPAVIGPLMLQYGMYGPDDSLKNHIDAEDYALVEASLSALGMPPQAIEKFRPWMAAVTLVTVSMMKAGLDPESGVEKILTDLATKQGKKFAGLESAAEQLGFFAGMEDQQQADFLKATIVDMPKVVEQTDAIIAAWRVGNMEELDRLLNDGMKAYPGLNEVLLTNRNKRWIKQIDTMMAEDVGTLFLAVGAGHMPGEDGVINLLKAAGYEVKRLE